MDSKIKVSRILHAGYVFEHDNIQICFDPIFENPFSRNCYSFPSVQFDLNKIQRLRFAAVFISHYHDDHCSMESLNLLDKNTPIYIYCVHPEMLSLIRELGFKKVTSLELNEPVQVGAFEVIPRMALDADVDSIFQVRVANLQILNVVDSWIDPMTFNLILKQGTWDLVLWPFQTMRELEVLSPSRSQPSSQELPEEWVEQIRLLNPRHIIPSSCQFLMESWSWYNHAFFPITYQIFLSTIQRILPETQVWHLDPSCSIEVSKTMIQKSSPLPWAHLTGESAVDYEYKPDLTVPTTSQVATHLGSLNDIQNQRVENYLCLDIKNRYRSLPIFAGSYFEKSRNWRLCTYDHLGVKKHFDYIIRGSEIESAEFNEESVSWLTEVPMVKLYAALELGEAMTSMYLRINDTKFNSEIEKEVQEADIMEDPLVRCLFEGVFASYQKAQLRELKRTSEVDFHE